jgi:hypothetical protein
MAKDRAKKIASYSAIGILGLAIGFLFVLLVGFGVVGILNLISGVNL